MSAKIGIAAWLRPLKTKLRTYIPLLTLGATILIHAAICICSVEAIKQWISFKMEEGYYE